MKRNLNEKNSCEKNLNFNLSEKITNNSSNLDNINIDNILNYNFNDIQQNDNFDINLENNFGHESFLTEEEMIKLYRGDI